MNKQQIKKMVTQVMREEPDAESIRSISLFGSFAREEDRADSDIDLLFETSKTMSLFQVGGLQNRLQQKLGRKVDFVPQHSIIPQLKKLITSEAETIYERK